MYPAIQVTEASDRVVPYPIGETEKTNILLLLHRKTDVITDIDDLSGAMINRLNAEGKPGFTRMPGPVYSTQWNGGLRTTACFYSIIGLLTGISGH